MSQVTAEGMVGRGGFSEIAAWASRQGVRIELDLHGYIERISYGAGFDPSVDIEGLRIGMSVADALAAAPYLDREEPDRDGVVRHEGFTPKRRVEVTASFRDGKLATVVLAAPGTWGNLWTKVEDTDEMLETWAAHCTPWANPPDAFVAYARWLRRADPDERHVAAMSTNWDYGLAPLIWMIRQPDCDLATALFVFFNSEPSSYLDFGADRPKVPAHALVGYDLLMEVRAKLIAGFYTRSAIAYDGEVEMARVRGWRWSADQIAAIYPPQVDVKLLGRRLDHSEPPPFAIY